jgi:hypothetical protein
MKNSKCKLFCAVPVVILLILALCKTQGVAMSDQKPPGNCEQNSLILDNTRYVIEKDSSDTVVVAIARLGTGEVSRKLNRRRLENLRTYWRELKLPEARLILAEGEDVEGYGRVELYVMGKLHETLTVERGKDLCVVCCGDDHRYYPLRKP